MASSYYTDGRVHMMRLQAGFVRCNDIVKDFVRVKLSETLGFAPPDFPDAWRQWCHENHDHIRRYRFWRNQSKETDGDKEIPIFDDVDITFFNHLMTVIAPDCPGFDKMKEFRNLMAHSTSTEIDDELEFEDLFRKIEDAVDSLFDKMQEQRRSWRRVLNQIRRDDIHAVERKARDFETLVAAAKARGETFNVAADTVFVNKDNKIVYNMSNCQLFLSGGHDASPIDLSTVGIRQYLIDLPPILKKNWKSANRFPVGVGFVAGILEGRLLIWGGCQVQPNGNFLPLPTNVIYVHTLSSTPQLPGKWEVIEATGSIHPESYCTAAVVCGQTLYISGGGPIFEESSDALSTLSSAGKFRRLHPAGETPPPIRDHKAFAFEGKAFFLCGYVTRIDERRKDDFVEMTDRNAFYTNDLYRYDPETNVSSRLSMRGAQLTPRVLCAVAVLGDSAFIHGGICNGEGLKDFYSLDMKTLQLTEITDTGYPMEICAHTATPVSERHIMFVGGSEAGEVTNKVQLYDVETREWKEETPLSSEIGKGLQEHRAIGIRREKGAFVLCLGGYVDYDQTTHPRHMIAFDVTF